MNSTYFWLVGEGEDFQLANSSSAPTTTIQDMVLSCIEQSNQKIQAKILYLSICHRLEIQDMELMSQFMCSNQNC